MSFCRSFVAIACLLSCAACGPSSELAETGPLQGRFYLSDEFSPSGHMGDGENPGFITADINENCKARPAGAGGDCYRFHYQPDVREGAEKWAGVYWVYPTNNWGKRQGRLLYPPYKRVRFKAAAEPRCYPQPDGTCIDPANPMNPKEPRVSFQVGGIGTNPNDPQPFADQLIDGQLAVNNERLGPDWVAVEIDLTGKAPDTPFYMVSGFCWTVNYQPGVPTAASPPTVIYIDDIVWDTE